MAPTIMAEINCVAFVSAHPLPMAQSARKDRPAVSMAAFRMVVAIAMGARRK
jgi:hypothetical protein